MLEFKALTLEDRPLIDSYVKLRQFFISEYSFISLYIWRRALNIEYCIYENTLILKKTSLEHGSFFMQPIGYTKENFADIIETLIQYSKQNQMQFLFRNIEEGFREELKALSRYQFAIDVEENNFDYIYESEKLINLPGRKLSSKRNHFTRFVNSYNYRVEDITVDNTQKCIEASKQWCLENGCEGLLAYEQESIMDMLLHRDKLNFKGIVVYVDNVISAFTICEIMSPEMAIIHIEKAFSNVHGLYTFINRTFAEKYLRDIKFINREDDMGLAGLRKAKESYHPYKLEYKYTVKVQ